MASQSASRALPRALRRSRWPQQQLSRRRIATAAAVEQQRPEPFLPEHIPSITPRGDRKQNVRDAKPFSDFLTDNFSRQHDYLRISLTERCNLRCLYCMPEEGIRLSPNRDILTTAEIYYLSALFVNQGVNKIRLTGGEPTVRKDIVPLMQQLGTLRRNGLKEIALTTNAISLHRKLDDMVEAGLTGVNISLDTLDPHQFVLLTRRQGFEAVMKSINKVLEMNKLGAGIQLKINCVAMRGLNDHQILPFVDMTRDEDIEVRFIEYMPFGGNKWSEKKMLPYAEMLDLIGTKYPSIERLQGAKNDTSKTWQVPGFKGRVGFITSMTHNFCGTCNRLRITSDGNLKVCLHGETEVSLRDLLRKDNNADPMDEAAFEAIRQIELDRRKQDSYRSDGEEGWISKERELLNVIGAAVKRKKAKHAGIGELEKMKNRPMILIGDESRTRALPIHSSRLSSVGLAAQSVPWLHVPTHLLHLSSSIAAQSRLYSTNRNTDDQPSTNGEPQHETDSASSRLASTFGFQSLSGLFQEPSRGRYSRPRRPEMAEISPGQQPDAPVTEKRSDHLNAGTGFFTTGGSALGNRSVPDRDESMDTLPSIRRIVSREGYITEHVSSDQATSLPRLNRIEVRGRATAGQQARRLPGRSRPIHWTDKSPATGVGQTSSGADRTSRGSIRKTTAGTRPNPFATKSPTISASQNPSSPDTTSVSTKPAWGLVRDDHASADSISELCTYATEPLPEDEATSRAGDKLPTVPPASTKKVTPRSAPYHPDTGPSSEPVPKLLTHVKASGEAHMVDVGAKEDTKRVAVAVSSVHFSNDDPFRLISENSNKKGDVLGVARIAGIMGAKRTSDIVPLCHPISISKVEVDVELLPPGHCDHCQRKTQNGGVSILAQVECCGPTGVEMEALTAALTAALTVVDMCKAVDRQIRITNTEVVYKSGGRSGLYCYGPWARNVGRGFLEERGLEVPVTRKPWEEKPGDALQVQRARR
ncbi:Molybdenum cofactor biosynthesis protein 1 [Fulvia fulva]|nr:Molybdenum cofactor biosynthesis protein 1 [Fulvia fulva]